MEKPPGQQFTAPPHPPTPPTHTFFQIEQGGGTRHDFTFNTSQKTLNKALSHSVEIGLGQMAHTEESLGSCKSSKVHVR